MSKTIRSVLVILAILSLAIVVSASAVYLYEKRKKIKSAFGPQTSDVNSADVNYDASEMDIYWAKEILNGGYILHFRHAERDKWLDVQMYDALESDVHQNGLDESRYAENDYFGDAVCLNERGKVQAKAIGEHIKYVGLPIGNVISSVSCRARQTAELAFGGFDSQHRRLLHKGPYTEKPHIRTQQLTEFYQNLDVEDGVNTIVSGHNNVIECEMFINNKCPNKPRLEEGGFYIFSKSDDGLIFEYEFHSYHHFSRAFFER
ncbi:histidine phosphatase family protein [Ruegeria arenilitoris]|uniref:histidine phosphatase family protein n=1 Tax=Ruegeria arenilitoris TaxID=1173585 RepID=UPI001481C0BF|nr:histidine phosphatase family protein [Ruegeria arenilitoris]